jgi:filamentous hemagglutinin family protein
MERKTIGKLRGKALSTTILNGAMLFAAAALMNVSAFAQSAAPAPSIGDGAGGGGDALTASSAPAVLPISGVVTRGQAGISTSGNAMTITQSTQRAVIDWNAFSVGANGSVNFVQPNAQSATLNRVTGNTGSEIAGQINSNGSVYLINPNGIAITSSGTVRTGGSFVASTLDMADDDFMNGTDRFTGKGVSAKVSNAGRINAGEGAYVALLGGSVSNSGMISVPLGSVGLGSGEQIALDINGGKFMQVAVPTSALGAAGEALIDNSGGIVVNGGRVEIKAATLKDAVRNVINMSGSISADSAVGNGGSIILLGGDGGTTTVSGTLSARSTGASGDGGFIETSGQYVDLNGISVSTISANGTTGNWLIDPVDFTVAASGGDLTGAQLTANLASNNVTIQSSLGANGTLGNININDAVSWNANTLTLDAANNININAVMSATGTARFAGITGDTAQNGTSSNANAELVFALSPTGFTGRLDLAPTAGFSLNGQNYTIITSLGAAGSTTGTDLQGIQGNLTGRYVLGANIDASATAGWNSGAGFAPIGNTTTGFTGVFMGAGHAISGLSLNRTNENLVGFFSVVGFGARVTNIGIAGGTIGGAFTNGFSIGALAAVNRGSIYNNYSTATINANTATINAYVRGSIGGLVGNMDATSATVTNSFVDAAVNGGTGYLGGVVGFNGGTVSRSYARGSVNEIGGGGFSGGLVGFNFGTISLSAAFNSVRIASSGSSAGGLVGDNSGGATITQSFARGNIDATNVTQISGVVSLGGLVGGNGGTITQNYAATVIGNGNGFSFLSRGGLIGTNFTGVTNSNYWDTQVSGISIGAGGNNTGLGLTTAQMQDFSSFASTYAGWDFTNVWAPPAQTGQAGQTANYYPELYALSPVVYAVPGGSRTYGSTATPGAINGGPAVYAFGPQGDAIPGASLFSTTATSASNVGPYAVTAVGPSATSNAGLNYRVIVGAPGTLTITPAPLTVTYTATPRSSVYGNTITGLTGTASAAGLINGNTLAGVTTGTASFSTTASATSNVGSYAINGSGLTANSSNYTFTFAQAAGNANALTITARPLTISANPLSRLYGAANPALTYTVGGSGLVNGNTLSGALATAATTASNVGTYAITQGTLAASSNYAVTYNGANLSVTPAPLTVTVLGGTSVYGQSPANPGLGYSGLVNGETASVITGLFNTLNITNTTGVGVYNAGIGGTLTNPNYFVFSSIPGGWQVTRAPVTVTYTANPLSSVYGNAIASLNGTTNAAGLVNGDTLAGVTTGTAVWNTTANATSNTGSYAINGSGLAANSGNYSFTFAQAAGNATALTITARPITISANPLSRLYGVTNPALTYTLAGLGLVNGDTLSGALATTATAASNVGNYAITQGTLAASNNYVVSYTGVNLSVTPAPLTLTYTANPVSSIYGNAISSLTGTTSASGLVNGDTLASLAGTAAWTSNATSTSNVGSYAINGSGLSSGNYIITASQAAGNATALTMTARPITISANPLSRLYGATNPALTYTLAGLGLVNGDTLSGALATTATAASNVGNYAITQGTLAASNNYVVSYTGVNLSVTPAPLTLTYTANPVSSIYGNAITGLAGSTSASGLVNGDTLASLTSGTALFSTTAGATSNVGRYAINGSGLAANSGNYSFTFAQAAGNATALTITARPITITANPLSRSFAAPNPPLTYVVSATTANSGLVNGNVLTGALTTTATQQSASGVYPILLGTLTASGNYITNYIGAGLTINLPPIQALNSFNDGPASNWAEAAENLLKTFKGCLPADVSSDYRDEGEATATFAGQCPN